MRLYYGARRLRPSIVWGKEDTEDHTGSPAYCVCTHVPAEQPRHEPEVRLSRRARGLVSGMRATRDSSGNLNVAHFEQTSTPGDTVQFLTIYDERLWGPVVVRKSHNSRCSLMPKLIQNAWARAVGGDTTQRDTATYGV